MKKYNHTWFQRLKRPFLWLHWKLSAADQKLPNFDLVMRGIEKHDHKLELLEKALTGTYYVLTCTHPGCRISKPIETKEARELVARLEWVQSEIETRARCIIQNAEFSDRVDNFKKELKYYEGVKTEMLETIIKYL